MPAVWGAPGVWSAAIHRRFMPKSKGAFVLGKRLAFQIAPKPKRR
jgi:hypothetical protein